MSRLLPETFLFIGAWFVCGTADAATAVPEALRACMGEQDDAQRLACYDREMRRLAQTSETVAAAPAAAPTPAASSPDRAAPAAPAPAPLPAITPEEKFGYRGTIARNEEERRQLEGPDQLTARVIEVSALPHGQLVVKLDNGQVWTQKMAERGIRIKVADEVTIRKAALGSFMLRTPSGKTTRVTRTE